MRDYGKVHTAFWTSDTVRRMSEDGRTLAIYLLTSPHGTIAGVARIPDGYACEDLRWPAERIQAAFAELQRCGFAHRCDATAWVWVTKHFTWNPLENPNQRKAARKVADLVPGTCAWLKSFHGACSPHFELDGIPSWNPFETVPETLSKPFRNQEQEQEQEQEGKLSVPGDAEDPPPLTKTKPANLTREATDVLAYLNVKAERSYKPVKANLTLIAGRLSEGATVDECKAVIDAKVAKWRDDLKMSPYLRPKTLFSPTNFANYTGELSGGAGAPVGGSASLRPGIDYE